MAGVTQASGKLAPPRAEPPRPHRPPV